MCFKLFVFILLGVTHPFFPQERSFFLVRKFFRRNSKKCPKKFFRKFFSAESFRSEDRQETRKEDSFFDLSFSVKILYNPTICYFHHLTSFLESGDITIFSLLCWNNMLKVKVAKWLLFGQISIDAKRQFARSANFLQNLGAFPMISRTEVIEI